MSLSSENMMKLMAYADGELEGADRAEVESLLANDRDAAAFIEQVAGLGDFVKVGHDDAHAKTIAAFDVTDAVMAKVEAEEKPAKKVASLADARAKKASQTRIVAGVVAVMALAASVFLLARPDETPMGLSTGQGKPLAQAPDKPAPSDGPGVEVAANESPGQSVSVFYVPSGNELSTSVVVWVEETGEK